MGKITAAGYVCWVIIRWDKLCESENETKSNCRKIKLLKVRLDLGKIVTCQIKKQKQKKKRTKKRKKQTRSKCMRANAVPLREENGRSIKEKGVAYYFAPKAVLVDLPLCIWK